MFFTSRRVHILSVIFASFILFFTALLSQQTASASQHFRPFILFETPVPCSNLAPLTNSDLDDEFTSDLLPKFPCELVPLEAIASEAASRDAALLQPTAFNPTTPAVIVRTTPSVNPCQHATASAVGCKNYEDLVKMDLAALGKDGQKLLNVRERVLEILQQPNSCSAWFQQRDADTLETFRTLNFFIDRKGINYIAEVRQSSSNSTLFNPYVAKVIQEGGSYQTVTINAEGAFFQAQAPVLGLSREGGPPHLRGPHVLEVGPYLGGTMAAQVVTLLHELGHLVGLLPHDQGDVDGKSVQNTYEVLKYCRTAVESLPKRAAVVASR